MTTIYNVDEVVKGVNGFGSPFCSQIFSATLAGAMDTTVAVPTTASMGLPTANAHNKFIAVFSYQPALKVWVANNAVAAVPVGAGFAATTSELNPPAKYCKSGDTLHFFSTAGGDVSVAFYAILD